MTYILLIICNNCVFSSWRRGKVYWLRTKWTSGGESPLTWCQTKKTVPLMEFRGGLWDLHHSAARSSAIYVLSCRRDWKPVQSMQHCITSVCTLDCCLSERHHIPTTQRQQQDIWHQTWCQEHNLSGYFLCVCFPMPFQTADDSGSDLQWSCSLLVCEIKKCSAFTAILFTRIQCGFYT